jgi:hypothetical protein
MTYQTLFREQLGAEGKMKTSTSAVDSNYERLLSMKTEVIKTLFSPKENNSSLKDSLKN